jgi:hypothetical protein
MKINMENKYTIVKNEIKMIDDMILQIKTKLFMVQTAYDHYFRVYYVITLSLFILSSVVTFIEALRLSIIEYINKVSQPSLDEKILSTVINVVVLFLGIVITVLSSIIRFRNYREMLEDLREKQNLILQYIDKYKKQKCDLEFMWKVKADEITIEEIEVVRKEISEYNTKMESTNILQYLTTNDIIKYNKIKCKFENDLNEVIQVKNICITSNIQPLCQPQLQESNTNHIYRPFSRTEKVQYQHHYNPIFQTTSPTLPILIPTRHVYAI